MTEKPRSLAPVASDFLFYAAPDGTVKVQVLFRDETAWLTQKALAELFGVKVPAINKHLKNIYESGELEREATISKMEIVRILRYFKYAKKPIYPERLNRRIQASFAWFIFFL